MKVLVAGPSGVVGRPTVRLLVEGGHEVVGLVRSEEKVGVVRALGATPILGDVLDPESVTRAAQGVEAVVHLAVGLPTDPAPSRSDWATSDRRYVDGARNLIAAARAVGAHVYVQPSVLYVYGDHGEAWVDEKAPPKGGPMAKGPLEGEAIALAANGDGLDAMVLRFGSLYGRDAWHTQFLVSQARERELPILGDGKAYWGLVHAEDAARATVLAMVDAPAGSIYNVADDEPVRMGELVAYLAEQLGAPPPRKVPTLAARVLAGTDVVSLLSSSIRLSNRRLKRDLGFAPSYPSYREGLAEVLGQEPGASRA